MTTIKSSLEELSEIKAETICDYWKAAKTNATEWGRMASFYNGFRFGVGAFGELNKGVWDEMTLLIDMMYDLRPHA